MHVLICISDLCTAWPVQGIAGPYEKKKERKKEKKKFVARYEYTRRDNADRACVQNMFGTNV